jgi:hypothetical protein
MIKKIVQQPKTGLIHNNQQDQQATGNGQQAFDTNNQSIALNRSPSTIAQQLIDDNQQRATGNKGQQATGNGQQPIDGQPITPSMIAQQLINDNQQRATCNRQRATGIRYQQPINRLE